MLKEILSSELIKAGKSKDKDRVAALKMVKSRFQEWETAKGSKGRTLNDLSASQEASIIKKLAEEYDADADQYKNRTDDDSRATYVSYKNIAKILQEYLPKEVSPGEIKLAVLGSDIELIKPNMSNIINYIKNILPGADGKTISEIVRELLQ